MKNLIYYLLIFFSSLNYGQTLRGSGIDAYKYLVIEDVTYKNTKKILLRELAKAGYNVIDANKSFPKELEDNPFLALYVSSFEQCPYTCEATVALYTSDRRVFWQSRTWASAFSSGIAVKKAIGPMLQYPYNYNPSLIIDDNAIVENENGIDIGTEKSIREYFDTNNPELIEGIWEYLGDSNSYRLAIIKDDYKFKATVIEASGGWKAGETKATLETAASDEILTINWTMGNKVTKLKTVGTVKNNALIEFSLQDSKVILYKVYPKFDKASKNIKSNNGEWIGNGSGIIISKSGYIVTNNHVIEDADDIEVEFILNDEVKKFNAEIVQSDKVNDLAIIKIFDMNFDGLDNLPYNFKTRSSDVGTKVYAYGYPMALSLMGKEIKITDGIISSKSGIDGDITTYQISATIQPGNSGGPLFDDKGNLIGINSSGLARLGSESTGYTIKSGYVLNLIDVLPKSIDLPSSTKLQSLPLTEQIKEISKYVVLVKVK